MSKTELANYRKELSRNSQSIYGDGTPSIENILSDLTAWCNEHQLKLDSYGKGELVESFERKIANMLGFPAARYMPSGTMAQQIAIKIWCDRANCNHFGMHPTSHLELHEEQGYETLYGLRSTLIGPKLSPLLATHFESVEEAISVLLIELPIREAGGQLPSWEQLEDLKASTANRGVRLHMDGARLWETKSFYQKEYKEICKGFDSVYVSLYKGIAALPGAVLLGPTDFIKEATIWQRRSGGTLKTMGLNIVSATMQMEQKLSGLELRYERAKTIAKVINRFDQLSTLPKNPHINMFHIYITLSQETAYAARDAIAEEFSLWLFSKLNKDDATGSCYFEVYVGDVLLELPDTTLFDIANRLNSFIYKG